MKMSQRFRMSAATRTSLATDTATSGPTALVDGAQPPPPDEDDLEDGGWVGWTQVAAAFALYFNHLLVPILQRPAQQLRRLPDVLRQRAPAGLVAVRDILDRVHPGLLPHGRRRRHRPPLRRGPLPRPRRLRLGAPHHGLCRAGVVSLCAGHHQAPPRARRRRAKEDDGLLLLLPRLGMVSIIKGVGSLVGPPISGAIVKATGGRYLGVQLFAAFGIMVTAVVSVAMRVDVARMEMKAQNGDATNEMVLETGVLQSEAEPEAGSKHKTAAR
ncbi:hypothetical protein PWT90_06722 [Aphanocladium album]|nr:hypothetical protein PWT90_06722 [Aphanocladium album]